MCLVSFVFFCCLFVILCFLIFFFFKQKTAYEMRISDWSSDVCSSDLHALGVVVVGEAEVVARRQPVVVKAPQPVECLHLDHRSISLQGRRARHRPLSSRYLCLVTWPAWPRSRPRGGPGSAPGQAPSQIGRAHV